MYGIVSMDDIRGAIRENLIDDGCEGDIENALSEIEKRVYFSDNYAE